MITPYSDLLDLTGEGKACPRYLKDVLVVDPQQLNKDSGPGAITMNKLRKYIYFYVKVNIFLDNFVSLLRIFGILRKNLAILRKNLFHSIGPWSNGKGILLPVGLGFEFRKIFNFLLKIYARWMC